MVMLEVFATQSDFTENKFQEKFGQVEFFLFSSIINNSKGRKRNNNKRRKIKSRQLLFKVFILFIFPEFIF